MRHRVHGWKLGRDKAHRIALRKNMIADLLCHEKIVTTEAKARMLRPAAERVITMAKRGVQKAEEDVAAGVHARRILSGRIARFRTAEDEFGDRFEVDVLQKLFDEIAPRYLDRPGGYTRMVKLGRRPGDNAKMAVVMLVEEAS
jgi:large subunit ribosomal protein L17